MAEQIWVRGDGKSAEMAVEIADVLGVSVATGSQPVSFSLLIAADDLPLAGGAPAIRIGPSGELQLPKDAALLAQVIVQATAESSVQGRRLNVVVAGCHGGAGTSRCARKLALAGNAPWLDASGHPHGRERVPLAWSQIDASDPPSIGMFRPGSGEPIICDAPGACTRLAAPEVMNVIAKARGPLVVDAGVWSPVVSQVPDSVFVLVCHRSRGAALIEVVQHSRIKPRLILTGSPSTPELRWAARAVSAKVARPHGWKKLWRYLSA